MLRVGYVKLLVQIFTYPPFGSGCEININVQCNYILFVFFCVQKYISCDLKIYISITIIIIIKKKLTKCFDWSLNGNNSQIIEFMEKMNQHFFIANLIGYKIIYMQFCRTFDIYLITLIYVHTVYQQV